MFLENFALHYIAEKAQMKICKHIRSHECALDFFQEGLNVSSDIKRLVYSSRIQFAIIIQTSFIQTILQ